MNDKTCAFLTFIISLEVGLALVFLNVVTRNEMNSLNNMGRGIFGAFIALMGLFLIFVLLLSLELIPKSWIFMEQEEKSMILFNSKKSIGTENCKEDIDTIVVLPTSLKSITKGFFAKYPSLSAIYFLSPNISIGERAFIGCFNLEEVHLPLYLETIDPYAFAMCKKLKKVIIPKTLEKIRNNAFEKCEKLKLLEFTGTENECVLNFEDYKSWQLSDDCKIKFKDKKEISIKDYVKKKHKEK